MSAHIIREYLDFYKMDYTKSVYLPEIGISSRNHKDQMSAEDKGEILKQTGVGSNDPSKTIMAQMMK